MSILADCFPSRLRARIFGVAMAAMGVGPGIGLTGAGFLLAWVGLFDEAGGVLFSGDALYDGELLDDLPHSNVAHYAQTMERLRDLDIRIGHGGHGPSFDNARKAVLIEDYLAGKRIQGCPG